MDPSMVRMRGELYVASIVMISLSVLWIEPVMKGCEVDADDDWRRMQLRNSVM